MMKNRWIAGFTAVLFVALALLGTSRPVEAAGSYVAETIRIAATLGTVTAFDRNNKKLSTADGMRLTSGSTITTGANSYAWLNLDDTKALKLSADTQVLITKYKSNLDVTVNKGSVLFDVSQKLTEQENYHIRSANMVMGIRGTIGYVTKTGANTAALAILEGTAHVQVTDQINGIVTEGDVTAGQIVDTDALASQNAGNPAQGAGAPAQNAGVNAQNTPNGQPGALVYRKITVQMIPDYILAEAASGNAADAGRTRFTTGSGVFSGRIFDACGIDLRGVTTEEVKAPTTADVDKKNSLLKAWAAFDEELKRLAKEEEEKKIAEQQAEEEEEEAASMYTVHITLSGQQMFSYTITPGTSVAAGTVVTISSSFQAAPPNITVYADSAHSQIITRGSSSGQGAAAVFTATFTMPEGDVYVTIN